VIILVNNHGTAKQLVGMVNMMGRHMGVRARYLNDNTGDNTFNLPWVNKAGFQEQVVIGTSGKVCGYLQ